MTYLGEYTEVGWQNEPSRATPINAHNLGVMEDGIKRLFYYLLAGGGTGGGSATDGREVELRNNGEYIQWRYSGEEAWINLVSLSDLKGEKGDDYVLTEEDILKIAEKVKIDVPDSAADISFENEGTDLKSTNVQGAIGELSGQISDLKGVYYVATNYGISVDAEDNTLALQTLINTVSENGGGIIFFPVGIYNFKKASTKYAILLKSNVSIVGENIETTVFKLTEVAPYSLFYRMATSSEPLTGCCFSNFTVDAYETGNTNQVYGKAFYIQYLRDCVFRDLRLKGTIATALGIDYLDRVTIDGVDCIDCGRTYSVGKTGTSGIGIGTGGWDEENFTITNCVCVGSGQFGIFIENQHTLGWGGSVDYSKGCIIANCVVRGGLNHGIGVRGGENVTIIGCETYENAKHGIYVDNKCKNVKILNCSSISNGLSGAYLSPDSESSRIVVKGCTLVENTAKGIYVATLSDKLCVSDNLTDENEIGLYIGALTLNDCVIKGNAFLDDTEISAIFEGNTNHNDFSSANSTIPPTSITAESVTIGIGETANIVYTVEPVGSSKDVTFKSTNNNIATVNQYGTVTGVSSGSCEIIITSTLDTSVSTTIGCVVEDIAPTSITANDISVIVGRIGTLNFDVTPINANRSMTFESTNEDIATVDNEGNITGVTEGSCEIIITSLVDNAVSTKIVCTVYELDENNIIILHDELTIGKKLDDNGVEATQETSGVSDYVPINGGQKIYATCSKFVPSAGAAICEYDANRTFIKRTALYSSNGDLHKEYGVEITLAENTQYLRFSLNLATTKNSETECIIKIFTYQIDIFEKSTLIPDTKLTPDGSAETATGIYASDFIEVPNNAIRVNVEGYSYGARLCTYDSNKSLIKEYGAMNQSCLNNVEYDLEGISYIRFCTNTLGSFKEITFTWHLLDV